MSASGIVAKRWLLRRVRMAVLTVVALTVGLVGMHTLSGADSHRPIAPEASSHAPAGSPVAAEHERELPCECATPPPEHTAALMACVLALLVGLLVLTPPRWTGAVGIPWACVGATLARAPGALPHPRPPSLILLSISRT